MAVPGETMTTWGMETAGRLAEWREPCAIFARHEHSAPIPQSTMSTPYPLPARLRRMVGHAYVGYPCIPPPLAAVDGLRSVPPGADGLACVHLTLRGQGHRIAAAIGTKETPEYGLLPLPGRLI